MIYVFFAVFTIFFVGGTLIAFLSRKYIGAGLREFFVGGYRVGGFLAAMTYAATTYSAFMMVGLAGLTFATGVASLGFELVYLASTVLILSTFGVYLWSEARRRGWVSPTDMITDFYGSRAIGVAIAILYLFALVPYTSAQLKGIGEIFNSIGISYGVGVVIGAIAIALWTFVAGLWSVATTDAYQGIWMIFASIAFFVWIYQYLLPSSGVDMSKFVDLLTKDKNLLSFTWSFQMFIGMTIPWIFFALTNPQVVQRIYIPRDEKAYRRMVRYFAFYGFLYTILCVSLGLAYRAYLESVGLANKFIANRDAVAPYIISLSHPVLASIVYTSIMAAAISTADSIVLSVASSVVRDLYEKNVEKPRESISKAIAFASTATILLLAAVLAIARIGYVVELSVASSAYLLPLAPITLRGILKKNARFWQAAASLLLGEAVAAYATMVYGPAKMLTTPIAFNMPTPVWILVLSTIPLLA
ncbi:sodium:solute symporter family protein [Ignisphaera sp. 4213-co]|uniref:Sodium:solute symporter family protein n=1 Tax=Ignisphaera cupida TaxID=3050454 RepID=A0ABD4Z7D6_9CREN|nr:sodium:solute symporter family protein [Ignisphaera sp. 4213-co]MDK6029241.1 sodium:solute symporter family protein [Ignisphaera sp. 4213-co]